MNKLLPYMIAHGLLNRNIHDMFIDDDKSPNIKTYGSTKVVRHSPDVWKEMKQKPKTKRNAPCPCGSGKKYKKCCLSLDIHME
jgi:preprotein translocase subunit SecA